VLQKRFSSRTKINNVNGDKPQIEIINITPEMQAKEAEMSPRNSRTDLERTGSPLRSSQTVRDTDSPNESPRGVTRTKSTDSNMSVTASANRVGNGADTSPERNATNRTASPNATNKTDDLNTSRENNGPDSAEVLSHSTNKTDKSRASASRVQESSSSEESNKKELINLQGDPYQATEPTEVKTSTPAGTPTKKKSTSRLGFLKVSVKKKASSTPASPATEAKKNKSVCD
jgi:hypothetical protein